jgi:hypothetical protein
MLLTFRNSRGRAIVEEEHSSTARGALSLSHVGGSRPVFVHYRRRRFQMKSKGTGSPMTKSPKPLSPLMLC